MIALVSMHCSLLLAVNFLVADLISIGSFAFLRQKKPLLVSELSASEKTAGLIIINLSLQHSFLDSSTTKTN